MLSCLLFALSVMMQEEMYSMYDRVRKKKLKVFRSSQKEVE